MIRLINAPVSEECTSCHKLQGPEHANEKHVDKYIVTHTKGVI